MSQLMLIKPTIGRVVWYYPPGSRQDDQPQPALVARVHGDRMVNLAIFDGNGCPVAKPPTSIPLIQDGEPVPEVSSGVGYCVWMPYQKAQASKAEAEERNKQFSEALASV